jgi:hypothetical protein
MIEYSIELIKQILIIETIYSHINIKKAVIINNNIDNEFINLLKYFDHNVCTEKYINDFINYKKRLLIISYEFLENNLKYLLEDKYLDTIFCINNSHITETLLNKFKINKIVIYNI